MKRTNLAISAATTTAFLFLAAGCASPAHTSTASTPPAHTPSDTTHRVAEGQSLQCQLCYDESMQILRDYGGPKGNPLGNRFATIRKHECPDCRTQVKFYSQAGRPMIKCARCAPAGLPCDRCLPPQTTPAPPQPSP